MSIQFHPAAPSSITSQTRCTSCEEQSSQNNQRFWYAHPDGTGSDTHFIHEACFHDHVWTGTFFSGPTKCPGGCDQAIQYGPIPIRSLKGRIFYALNRKTGQYILRTSALPALMTGAMLPMAIISSSRGLITMLSQIWFGAIAGGLLQYGRATKTLPLPLTYLVKKVSNFTHRFDLGKSTGKYAVYSLTSLLAYETIEVVTYFASGTPLWHHIFGAERLSQDIPYAGIHLLAITIIPMVTIAKMGLCSLISR